MKIAIGCDHGGYDLKEILKAYLAEKGYEIIDKGCNDKSSCDYPVFGHAVAKSVVSGESDRGIVICTTGIGISIAANKVKGARAALCTNTLMAKMTRLHNNSNILALGADIVGVGLAKDMADVFLETEFSGVERHERRVSMMEEV